MNIRERINEAIEQAHEENAEEIQNAVNNAKKTLKELNREVLEIENEWIKKIEEVNEEYSEKRLFVFERIAEFKGEPIL